MEVAMPAPHHVAVVEPLETRAMFSSDGVPPVDRHNLVTSGLNPYFNLTPGFQTTLEGVEDGEQVRVVATVTRRTKVINRVLTRILKEVETHDGQVVEISHNFLAIDKTNNNL